MKNSGEIHEQLVTYDEEGGGEMDTNGYADLKKEKTSFPNPWCDWNVLAWYVSNSGNIAAWSEPQTICFTAGRNR